MYNSTFLKKRSSADFSKIPPLKVSARPLRRPQVYMPYHYPPNPYAPYVFLNTNFNPRMPNTTLGFNYHSTPMYPDTRYFDYVQSTANLPVITANQMKKNVFLSHHKTINSKEKQMPMFLNKEHGGDLNASKRKYRKKGGYALSALQGEFYEKRVMGTQSSRISQFWTGKPNTYPFTFKQTKMLEGSNEEGITMILERHRYDFKRVTPNSIDRKGSKTDAHAMRAN